MLLLVVSSCSSAVCCFVQITLILVICTKQKLSQFRQKRNVVSFVDADIAAVVLWIIRLT